MEDEREGENVLVLDAGIVWTQVEWKGHTDFDFRVHLKRALHSEILFEVGCGSFQGWEG
jgi:hypothetical protein